MISDTPLVLFCSPRGGSSLVAGVFVRHGFWTGKTFGGPDGRGSGGYINHENAQIKLFMKETFPLDAGVHRHSKRQAAKLRAFCEKHVSPGVPWMFKGPSEYYHQFLGAFPRMTAVMVFRDATQAVEAHVRRRGEKVRQGATQIVSQRYTFMTERLSDENVFRVDADRVVDGDLEQISPVLAQYGIELNHRLAMKGISPDLFHQ